jgi:SAM-dependent methyltransferase
MRVASSQILSDDRSSAALRCPRCRSHLLFGAELRCRGCGATYSITDGVPALVPGEPTNEGAKAFYSAEAPERFGRPSTDMPERFIGPVRAFLADVPDDALVVEIGSGRGAFNGIHPGYVATDFSLPALYAYSSGNRVQADAEALPFADGSIDAFFSIATLEHVPHPERALSEIDRCLTPGGRALLYPAWYVRSWAAKAIHVRPMADLSPRERLTKLTIPIRNGSLWWFAKLLPSRLRREYELVQTRRPVGFEYRRLEPNLHEHLVSDSDAFTSMDAHAAAAYFISRGYRDLRRGSPISRLQYRAEPVCVLKPNRVLASAARS